MIKELHPGDTQISAAGWNEMRAAVQGLTPGQQQYQSGQRCAAYVTIKNNTGSDLPAFSVVKIDGAMYSRSGDTFINQAAQNGVELNGNTPAASTDTIAITQAACASGEFVKAVVSGATACRVYKASNINYQYASVTAGQYGYLTGTDTPSNIRVLWIAAGTGAKEAYVLLDNVAEGEYFIINPGNDGTQTAAHTPSIFTKGSLHYISYNNGIWTPNVYNEEPSTSTLLQRPSGSRLVVCQIDAPNSSKECKIPYFTPESNMGVAPNFTSSVSFFTSNRCGVKPGEHAFTNKFCDYAVVNGAFEYNPQFVANVTVGGLTGGGYDVTADICGEDWLVNFPNSNAGLSATNFPDIYPYDVITVLVDCEAGVCYALDYPTDYEAGSTQAFYQTPGRGWDAITTDPAMTAAGFTLYQKVKTGAIL